MWKRSRIKNSRSKLRGIGGSKEADQKHAASCGEYVPKEIQRIGAAFADHPQVGFPHVGANELDAFGRRFADEGEELFEAFDGAVLADPQQAGATLLDLVDQSPVLVTLGVLDLVDTDCPDRTQVAMLQPPLHHILYRLADLVPRGAERHGGFLPGQFARPMCQKHHVGLGRLVLADCPGQFVDPHAAGPAIDPPHAIQQQHRQTPDRDEFKAAQAEPVVGRARLMAARAHRLRTEAGPHVDLDAAAVRAEPCLVVDKAWKVLAMIEQADQSHG